MPLGINSQRFGDSLQMNLLVTYLRSYNLDDIEYVGTIGAYNISGAFPKYKANLRLGYKVGPVDLNYDLQYLGAMDNQGNIPAFEDPSGYQGVTGTMFHDLSAQWGINESVDLTLGVRNLTDQKPKFFDSPIDQNTDPATFDTLGRFFFGSVRAKF